MVTCTGEFSWLRRYLQNGHFSLMCLVTIIKLDKFFISFVFSCWQVKGGSNAPKNAAFGYCKGYCMQKLWRVKVCVGRCLKIVSLTYIHIDFGDVYRVSFNDNFRQGAILGVPTSPYFLVIATLNGNFRSHWLVSELKRMRKADIKIIIFQLNIAISYGLLAVSFHFHG